jgi:hypothetical protein
MKLQACIDELLKRGLDDWVDASEIAWSAKSVGRAATQEEIRNLSLELIREVVRRGLMKIGDLGVHARNGE